MAVPMKEWGLSAVYGLVDIGTEYADKTMALPASGTFKNITDWQRTAATLGGAAVSWFSRGRAGEYAKTFVIASTPLLEKSVANLFLSLMCNPTRFTPRAQILVRKPGTAATARSPGNLPGAFY